MSNSSSFTDDADDVDSPLGFPFDTGAVVVVEIDAPFDCELDGVLF